MRRMSMERRRVVVMGGATAAVSGFGGLVRQVRPHWVIAWMVVEAAMAVMTIVLLVRWKRRSRVTDVRCDL